MGTNGGAGTKPEDHLLFYFSGHAENRNGHYLILYDYEDQRMSKVQSVRTVTGGVIREAEFRDLSASCRGTSPWCWTLMPAAKAGST
ncbi:MAG: hypothetical protein H6556_23090 [Lewinellaceae bacterium]|nr:hypothetical protein [Lewinellaceae bacterium]